MGTRMPCLSSCSTTWGTAAAASSLFTVTRTSSDPARASAATCCTVPGMSAVSVLVMDCTTIGASDPTRTPPTRAVTVFLRGILAIWEALFYHGDQRASNRRGCLTEELAVRPQANQLQNLSIRLSVDQQQIRLEMAFAMILPIASQPMVAALLWERHVFD